MSVDNISFKHVLAKLVEDWTSIGEDRGSNLFKVVGSFFRTLLYENLFDSYIMQINQHDLIFPGHLISDPKVVTMDSSN